MPGVFPTRVMSSTLPSTHSLPCYFEVDDEVPSHPKPSLIISVGCVHYYAYVSDMSIMHMFQKMFDPTELILCATVSNGVILMYHSRELTLFWSKLLIRLESSADVFLEQSKKMALLCRSVCHILFFIKVIQNEVKGKKN